MAKTAEKKQPNEEPQAYAKIRQLRISPRKLNLVCGLIRGKKADKAMLELEFSRKRIAKDVMKALRSAIANAENNHGLDIDRLYVKEAHVGKGLVMKRYRPRAKGRAYKIRKPFSQLTIVVAEKQENA